MGCQKSIAGEIVQRGGDYGLPMKSNQQNLEVAVAEVFEEHLEEDFARVKVSRLEEEEQHHGRQERRTYFQINVPASLAVREEWAGLKTLGMVIRARESGGKETGEVQYYIKNAL